MLPVPDESGHLPALHHVRRIFVNTRFLIPVCGLISLLSLPANAQPAPPAAPQLPAFRSAMQGYQPFIDKASEGKTIDWKKANDTTARIGGWRAYARQASASGQPERAGVPDLPASGAAPDAPAKAVTPGGTTQP